MSVHNKVKESQIFMGFMIKYSCHKFSLLISKNIPYKTNKCQKGQKHTHFWKRWRNNLGHNVSHILELSGTWLPSHATMLSLGRNNITIYKWRMSIGNARELSYLYSPQLVHIIPLSVNCWSTYLSKWYNLCSRLKLLQLSPAGMQVVSPSMANDEMLKY